MVHCCQVKYKLYTLFANHFAEFDPVKRAFTFSKETLPQMTPGITEDDKGVIWAATYPKCGIVSFNPETRDFKDYGYLYEQNWKQYPNSIAADDAGWIYIATGVTASQILVFDPATGKAKPVLEESDRRKGSAFVYRDQDGSVYGKSLSSSKEDDWYQFHMGTVCKIGKHAVLNPKTHITGSQGLFYNQFPDGKKLKELDLIERKLIVETHGGASQSVSFDYASEGAWVMGVAAAPDGTIAGGTTFPMRFFNFNPKTGKMVNKAAFGQFDALALQGDRFYFGVYPTGSLCWSGIHPSPGLKQKKARETNPKLIAASSMMVHRPHRVLAYPDGKTIILTGTPEYGYTGGGLLFWDREKKERYRSQGYFHYY